jgi:ATP-dependent Clp protease ATP-binding subunit ClpA
MFEYFTEKARCVIFARYEASQFGATHMEPAARASGRFLRQRPLPQRALDLLDEAGAPMAMVQRVLEEPATGDFERMMAAVAAQVPADYESLPFLAASLSHCPPEAADRLAHTIRMVRRA